MGKKSRNRMADKLMIKKKICKKYNIIIYNNNKGE